MPRVLVVGGGSELQPQLRRIAADVTTVVLCRAALLPHLQQPQENQALVVLNDACPTDQWVAAARAIHAQFDVQAVASFADLDQDRAAAIAADLGLPFHSARTVGAVQDKLLMRTRLNEAGVEAVPFRAVGSVDDLARFCESAGLPVIVKPSRGWASSGIGVVRRPADVAAAYRRAAEAHPPLFGPSPPIAERFYTGREFSVETITHAGRHHVFAVTGKVSDRHTLVELGHVVPASLAPQDQDLLVRHVSAALTALGVRAGPTHTEVILTERGPVIVETHLRDAGDEIPRLVQDATGVDMAGLFLRQVLGDDLAEEPAFAARRAGPRYLAAGAIRYLAPERDGVLAGIDGWAQARAMPGVVDAVQLVADGTRLAGLTHSFARLGYVRTRADDADAAVALAEKAVAALTVRIEG